MQYYYYHNVPIHVIDICIIQFVFAETALVKLSGLRPSSLGWCLGRLPEWNLTENGLVGKTESSQKFVFLSLNLFLIIIKCTVHLTNRIDPDQTIPKGWSAPFAPFLAESRGSYCRTPGVQHLVKVSL